jgi:hypothetical protein
MLLLPACVYSSAIRVLVFAYSLAGQQNFTPKRAVAESER